MKFTKKQHLFVNKLFTLIENNNLHIQYEQTFRKKIMIYELINKFNLPSNEHLKLQLSCYKHNEKYMNTNIMFSEELISDELVDEIKTLFKVGQLDNNSKNISYLLCILKKMKINFKFIGIINKQYNRISINHDKSKTDNYSIWGYNMSV